MVHVQFQVVVRAIDGSRFVGLGFATTTSNHDHPGRNQTHHTRAHEQKGNSSRPIGTRRRLRNDDWQKVVRIVAGRGSSVLIPFQELVRIVAGRCHFGGHRGTSNIRWIPPFRTIRQRSNRRRRPQPRRHKNRHRWAVPRQTNRHRPGPCRTCKPLERAGTRQCRAVRVALGVLYWRLAVRRCNRGLATYPTNANHTFFDLHSRCLLSFCFGSSSFCRSLRFLPCFLFC